MTRQSKEHHGHRIELVKGKDGPVLRIDGIPVKYGRLPDGRYFLDQYAYDWTDDLEELARRFVEHQRKAEAIRRERRAVKGGG